MKVTKIENTPEMAEGLETQNEKERNKILQIIKVRILNSVVTVETEDDNDNLQNTDFIENSLMEVRDIKAGQKQCRAKKYD